MTLPPSRWLNAALLVLVRAYQCTLRPLLGGHCRFTPSCSEYAVEALRTHTPPRAITLILRRVFSCHPMGRAGYDPVPPADSSDSTKGPFPSP